MWMDISGRVKHFFWSLHNICFLILYRCTHEIPHSGPLEEGPRGLDVSWTLWTFKALLATGLKASLNLQDFRRRDASMLSKLTCFVLQTLLITRTWKPSGSLIQSLAARLQGSVYRAKDWSQIVVMLLLDACRLDFSPFCRTFDVDNVDSSWCKARLEVMQHFWCFHAVVAEFLLVTSYRSNTSAILRCWLVGLWQMACAISGHPCIREIISWRAASLGWGISPQADVDPMPRSWPKAINKSFQPEPKLAHEITLNMLSSFPIASPLLKLINGVVHYHRRVRIPSASMLSMESVRTCRAKARGIQVLVGSSKWGNFPVTVKIGALT